MDARARDGAAKVFLSQNNTYNKFMSKKDRKIIFIGNPVPEDMVKQGLISNINIADNIAQNVVVKGLYKHYEDDLTVITLSPDNKSTEVDLGGGLIGRSIQSNTLNRIFFYISIAINYTTELFKVLKGSTSNETVVITNGPYIYMALPILLARIRYRLKWIPFLIGAVEIPEEKFPLNLVSLVSRWTIKRADGAITYVARSPIDYMPGKPFVEIVYHINESLMKIYSTFKAEKSKKFTITYTGALTDIYNIDAVIGAIKSSGSMYRWVFAGVGKYSSEIKRLSLDERYDVAYLGKISNIEAAKLQMESHLLLCLKGGGRSRVSRYYSKYAASGKLSEYLCSGVPILAGDIPAFPDIIKGFTTLDGKQDAREIIINIADIKKHYRDKTKKSEEGQRYALKYFDADYQNSKIYTYLENL